MSTGQNTPRVNKNLSKTMGMKGRSSNNAGSNLSKGRGAEKFNMTMNSVSSKQPSNQQLPLNQSIREEPQRFPSQEPEPISND